MRSASKSAGPATATSYERLRRCSGVHSPVRPYIQKVKKMMKLNARLAAEGKPHKTCKPEGVIIPPGTVVKNHGENKPVLEDDPIGWLNSCAVVLRYTARHVNNLLNGKRKSDDFGLADPNNSNSTKLKASFFAELRQGRIDQGSLPCSTQPRSPSQTPPSSRHTHRLLRLPGAGSSNRRGDRRACRST